MTDHSYSVVGLLDHTHKMPNSHSLCPLNMEMSYYDYSYSHMHMDWKYSRRVLESYSDDCVDVVDTVDDDLLLGWRSRVHD